MSFLDYALAVLLLMVPLPDSEAARVCCLFPTLRPALARLGQQLELIDPRESHYVLARESNFAGDLRLLRRRVGDLAYAPPSQDALFWPDRSLINSMLTFNRAHRRWLEAQLGLGGPDSWVIRETLIEVDQLYILWDLMRDARCDYYYITVRRQALLQLRERLGYEAYYSGRLPAVVPLHRFREIP